MGELDDVANGIKLALDITLARLEQDGQRAVDLLNASTPPELTHALGYLADLYQGSLVREARDDRERATSVFKKSIANGGARDDLMRAQMRLLELGGDDL